MTTGTESTATVTALMMIMTLSLIYPNESMGDPIRIGISKIMAIPTTPPITAPPPKRVKHPSSWLLLGRTTLIGKPRMTAPEIAPKIKVIEPSDSPGMIQKNVCTHPHIAPNKPPSIMAMTTELAFNGGCSFAFGSIRCKASFSAVLTEGSCSTLSCCRRGRLARLSPSWPRALAASRRTSLELWLSEALRKGSASAFWISTSAANTSSCTFTSFVFANNSLSAPIARAFSDRA